MRHAFCKEGNHYPEYVIASLPSEVDPDNEMAVLCTGDGEPTNRYADGIVGVVAKHEALAREDEQPFCAEHRCEEVVWHGPMEQRMQRLMPGGIPRWVRCYDSGPDGAIDRYTVVFTGRFDKGKDPSTGYPNRFFPYLAMNAAPFHPQGFCQHGEGHNGPIDRPTYGHLGKRIKFTDLPEDCQKAVMQDYVAYWDLVRLVGFYHEHGYNIWREECGRLVGGEPVYTAGNSPHESQGTVPVARGESLGTLRKWCIQTGKEMAEEQGLKWGGCSRESDPYDDADLG